MSQVLHVPEDLYAQIARYAQQKREDVDAVGVRLLEEALRSAGAADSETPVESTDPFTRLAGIISVDDLEAGMRHDEYFGHEDDDAEH